MSHQRLLEILKTHSPRASASMDQVRVDFEDFYAAFQGDCPAVVERASLFSTVSAFRIHHPDIEPENCMLFLHGGGFTIGSSQDHLGLCSRLSLAAATRIISIDYRLAPEYRFPAALEDCLLAYETLLKEYAPEQIVVAGISAGGNLLLALLLLLKEKGLPMPAAAVAMSPAVDLLFGGESVSYNAANDWILAERLVNIRQNYLGDADPCNPLVSPIHGNLAGLPPLLLQVGTHELLLDDIRRFAAKLHEQGSIVQYEEWDGMFHCWQVFAAHIAEGQQAIQSAGTFVRQHTGQKGRPQSLPIPGKVAPPVSSIYLCAPVNALVEGIFEENIHLAEVLQHGDFGLGTFDDLDGEMIILDGRCYQINAAGKVSEVDAQVLTPFAAVTFYKPWRQYKISEKTGYDRFAQWLHHLLASPNLFHAIRIEGEFAKIRARSVPKQANYHPLSEIVHDQVIFDFSNIRGTLAGFYTPAFMASLSVPGMHLHFLSEDMQHGGHLLECVVHNARVGIQAINKLELSFPLTPDYLGLHFHRDIRQDLNKVEK